MKKIGWFIVLQLMVLTGFSQLQGKVVTKTGEALPGAHLTLSQESNSALPIYKTASSKDGSFQLDYTTPGQYWLKVSYLGYQTIHTRVDIPFAEPLIIRLEETLYLSDDVIVQATMAKDEMPVIKMVIHKKDIISDLAAQDIPFLLSLTPGLVESSETGIGIGYTGLRIRGTDPSRINVTINGIPLNDAENQVVYWVDLPDLGASVDQIEVQRGVGTSSHGTSAFGASINLKTNGLNPEPSGIISCLAGSFNTLKTNLAVGSGLLKNHFAIDARYSLIKAGSYIQHGYSDLQSLYLSGTYYGKKNLLKMTILHGVEQTGITWWGVPDYMIDSIRNYNPSGVYDDKNGVEHYYDNDIDNYTQTHYQLHYSHQLTPKTIWNSALHLTHGGGYYEQYQDDANSYHSTLLSEYGLPDFYISSGHTIYQSDLIRQKWVVNNFYGFTTHIDYQADKLNLVAGLSANQYDGNHFGLINWMENNMGLAHDYEWYRNEATKKEASAFVRATWTLLPSLYVFGDLQVRTIDYTMEGPDDDLKMLHENYNYSFMNPKTGLKYELAKNQTAFASFSIANREPTRTDIKEAAGDPLSAPKPERLYDFEAGYQLILPKGNLGINFYFMNYKDQLVPTGEKSDVGYDIMTNIPESYRLGAEIMAGYTPTRWLNWTGNASFSRNRIKSYLEYASYYDADWNEFFLSQNLGETHLAYSPEILLNSRFSFSLIKGLNVDFISKFVGSQYYDNSSDENRKLDSYFINNLHINYQIPSKFAKEIALQLQIKNLFNTDYISSAYGGNWYENAVLNGNEIVAADEKSWAYFFPQAGIQIYGGIRISF